MQETLERGNREVFPWVKLPAELRNSIYDLALVSYKSVEFIRSCSSNRVEYLRRTDYEFIPNLLLIDKATYKEAAPLLYRNTFHFYTSSPVYLFISRLSPTTRSWMEAIVLDPFYDSASSQALTWLNELTNLKRLELQSGVFTATISAERHAKVLLKNSAWRRFFKKLGKVNGDPKAGADIVCFGETYLNFRAKFGLGLDISEESQRFQAALRDLLE